MVGTQLFDDDTSNAADNEDVRNDGGDDDDDQVGARFRLHHGGLLHDLHPGLRHLALG